MGNYEATERLLQPLLPADRVGGLLPRGAGGVGRARGVPEAAVWVYAESESRSHLVLQLSKLLALALTTLRLQAGLPRWEVIVTGRAFGRVVQAPDRGSRRNIPPTPKVWSNKHFQDFRWTTALLLPKSRAIRAAQTLSWLAGFRIISPFRRSHGKRFSNNASSQNSFP